VQAPHQVASADEPSEIRQIYTWKHVVEKTRVLPGTTSLRAYYGLDAEDMQQIFGCEDEHVSTVSTYFVSSPQEGEAPSAKGNVFFLLSYSPSIWMCKNVFRDRELAPDLRVKGVVKIHVEKLGLTEGPRFFVLDGVYATDGGVLLDGYGLRHKDVLSDEQLDALMKTMLGRCATSTLQPYRLRVDRAQIIKMSKSSMLPDSLLNYVVLRTAPF
jgi:hypothetical protein